MYILYSLDEEDDVKVWKSSTSESISTNLFERFFSIARQGIFPHFGSYLWKNDRILIKMLPDKEKRVSVVKY